MDSFPVKRQEQILAWLKEDQLLRIDELAERLSSLRAGDSVLLDLMREPARLRPGSVVLAVLAFTAVASSHALVYLLFLVVALAFVATCMLSGSIAAPRATR